MRFRRWIRWSVPMGAAAAACVAAPLPGLAYAAPAGSANVAPSSSVATTPTAPYWRGAHQHTRTPFGVGGKRVCGTARPGAAHCDAVVATTATGAPLTGSSPSIGGYYPADLQSAYQLPSATAGTGQTVAIVDAYDDPNAASDLAAYRTQFGLPACTTTSGCFRKVNQTGGTTPPTADSGWATEISLDLDMVSAICPNCHILLVEANSNNNSDLDAAVNEAASMGATAISNSYGGGEYPGETSEDPSYDHPGIMITASAGDSGYGPEYPAASQYVTAVGGTSLTRDSTTPRGWSESVWSTSSTEGTGSGCSAYETKPSWQKDTGCSNRTIADVSADADPNTGVAVYDTYKTGGNWAVYGGTSVSSPIIASVYALGGGGSDLNYGSAPYSNAAWLNDVTSGSTSSCGSYLCTAGPGYDGPTGMGTPAGVSAFGGTTAAPTVTGVSPAFGTPAGGTSVTVSGTNFIAGSTFEVDFGGVPAQNVQILSPTQLTASSPPGSGVVDVTVTTPAGTSTTTSADQYSYSGTEYVSSSGTDTGNCQSSASPCATVAYAVVQGAFGNKIEVSGTIGSSGSSAGSTTIPANLGSLTIEQWPNQAQAVLDGGGSSNVITVDSGNSLVLQGLILRDAGSSHDAIQDLGSSVSVTGSTLTGGYAGIQNSDGSVTVATSTITSNSSYGIFGSGTSGAKDSVTVSDSSITNSGDGIYDAGYLTINVMDSTLAGDGSGVDNGVNGSATVSESTLAQNAHAITNSGTATLVADTISGSTGVAVDNVSGTASLGATIVAANPGGNCTGSGLSSLGYNLTDDVSGTTCGLTRTSDVLGASPALGSLQNNGGPTYTMMPSSTSPAIGRIPPTTTLAGVSVCPGSDQRGITRPQPQNSSCAVGAVEVAGTAPSITSAATTAFTSGSFNSFQMTATGTPTPTLTETGTLPSGLTFANGVLSGTPAPNTGGSYFLTIRASNGVSPTAVQGFTLVVKQAPTITSSGSTTFTVGRTSSFQVTATGGPTPTFTESGALPSGVTFSSYGQFFGTPSAGTAGSYPLTITASNGVSPDATQPFTLTVNESPSITSAASATFTVGTAGAFQATASGSPAASFSESGPLPAGVTFSSSGLLSGTPSAGTNKTYSFTITASNGVYPAASQSFTLVVKPAACSTKAGASLPDAVGIASVDLYGCPGYYVVDSYGQVSAFGSAVSHGGLDSASAQIVGMVAKSDGSGYWLVSANGAVHPFGTAGYFGGANNLHLSAPVLGMAVTQDAKGYWLVAQDGGIFSYGDAKFHGSMGGKHLNAPVVGIAVAPGGQGYWLVGSDGGVFTFTNDGFYGSMGGHALNKPIIGMTGTPDGRGYTLVASDGGVFNFGDSPFYGSLGANPPSSPVVDLSTSPAANGYYLVDQAGQVFNFGPGAKYFGGV